MGLTQKTVPLVDQLVRVGVARTTFHDIRLGLFVREGNGWDLTRNTDTCGGSCFQSNQGLKFDVVQEKENLRLVPWKIAEFLAVVQSAAFDFHITSIDGFNQTLTQTCYFHLGSNASSSRKKGRNSFRAKIISSFILFLVCLMKKTDG